MSLPQNGRAMDQPDAAGGSVRRARERMEAGMVRDDQRGGSAARSRPQALQGRTGPIGDSISRPTQIPQWPLPGSIQTPAPTSNPESSQQTTDRPQPPQRPPRPSNVPSILDGSRIQDPTPVFQYQPQNARDSDQEFNSSVPPTPSSLQTASTASISDFPLPSGAEAPGMAPARRSVTLGPPPSSRRGASSFYSNVSYVSPIPEESPRTRSHTSLASSAAMPETWAPVSPGNSPVYPDAPHGDIPETNAEESEVDGDGNKVVRSASLGKRGKPHIVMNKGAAGTSTSQRSDRTATHENPFADGTGLADSSSMESLRTASKSPTPPRAVAGFGDPTLFGESPAGTSYNRLSAIRRPPRLDMEAVEGTRARGSVTSLPGLLRRATMLAAMMDSGKRPGSRFDDFDYPDEKVGRAYSDRFSGKMPVFGVAPTGVSLVIARNHVLMCDPEQVRMIAISPGSRTCLRHSPLQHKRLLARAASAAGLRTPPRGRFRQTAKETIIRRKAADQGLTRKVARRRGNTVAFRCGGSSWSS